jgi:hypothetical protein
MCRLHKRHQPGLVPWPHCKHHSFIQRLCMQQYMFHGYSATAAAVGVCSIAHINGALCFKQVVDVPVQDCAARHAVCAAAHVQPCTECKRRWWIWPGGAASDSLQVDVPVLTAARYLWHVRSWCDVSWAVTVVKTRRSHAWSEHACASMRSCIIADTYADAGGTW